jgi:exoribonuclease II
MSDQTSQDDKMQAEIDFRNGVRGLHHIPPGAKVFLPAAIERSVWEYFSLKAEQNGVELSDLLTGILKRDIEINEALK